MDKRIRRVSGAMLALALLASSSGGRYQAQSQAPTITGYTLVSQRAITRTVYEYVYRGILSNPGGALASASATVVSSSAATVLEFRSRRCRVDCDQQRHVFPASGQTRAVQPRRAVVDGEVGTR